MKLIQKYESFCEQLVGSAIDRFRKVGKLLGDLLLFLVRDESDLISETKRLLKEQEQQRKIYPETPVTYSTTCSMNPPCTTSTSFDYSYQTFQVPCLTTSSTGYSVCQNQNVLQVNPELMKMRELKKYLKVLLSEIGSPKLDPLALQVKISQVESLISSRSRKKK